MLMCRDKCRGKKNDLIPKNNFFCFWQLVCKHFTEGKFINLNESRPGNWKQNPNWNVSRAFRQESPLISPDFLWPAGLTHDGELSGPLLGGDDLQGGGDGLDADDGLVGVVGAGHGQLQVAAHQQLGRDVLELQRGELQ